MRREPVTRRRKPLRPNLALKYALVCSNRPAYAVAWEASMGPGTLSRIVAGLRNASMGEQRRLAAALGATVRALFPRSKPPTRLRRR